MSRRHDTERSSEGAAALDDALARAIQGDERPLFARLARGSGLPGPRPNVALATQFARACAARGKASDALVEKMARLDADLAPGATELEFLPLCGVSAAGQRGAEDSEARERMLEVLHDAAEDLRFRVRDAVPEALARIGERAEGALAGELGGWMEGFFHAAAVLRALEQPGWLGAFGEADGPLALLEAAFGLLQGAERAASRYPGHKALVEAMGTAPGAVAARFGVPIFDALERWAGSKNPSSASSSPRTSRAHGSHGAMRPKSRGCDARSRRAPRCGAIRPRTSAQRGDAGVSAGGR